MQQNVSFSPCRLRNVTLQTPESRQSRWPPLPEPRKPNETGTEPSVFMYSLLPSFSPVLSLYFCLSSPFFCYFDYFFLLLLKSYDIKR